LWRRKCDSDSNGKLLANGAFFVERDSNGLAFRVLDTIVGKDVCHTEATGSPQGLLAEAGGRFLTASGVNPEKTLRVWEAATGKRLQEFKVQVPRLGYGGLSHDGKLLALTSGLGGSIHVWDVAKGKELNTFAGHRNGPLVVAFAADGRTVYTVNCGHWLDWSLRRWDAESGKELRASEADPSGGGRWAAFSPDGRLLAIVVQDGTLHLWDTAAGREVRTWKISTRLVTENGVPRPDARYPPQFSADGESIFVVAKGTIHRWDVRTGKELPGVAAPTANDLARVFPAPNGQSIVVSSEDQKSVTRLDLLDATSGRLLRTIGKCQSPVPSCVFSPNGKTLAVADYDGVVLWEVASGQERGRFPEIHYGRGLGFSPDGKLLAAGGVGVVRLLNPFSCSEVGSLDNCPGDVACLVFSPDGKRLSLAGTSNTALVCDVAALTAAKVPKAAVKPTAKELEALWADLSGAESATAFRAIARLAEFPAESVPFLREKLKLIGDPEEKRIAKLIVELDDSSFEVRQKANAALESLGNKAAVALAQTLEKTQSAEVRERAQRLLDKLKDANLPSKELVDIRCVEVLETSDSPAARDLLRELAKGDVNDSRTLESKAAVQRFEAGKGP
jgi:WD40 repeat protein